MITILAGQGNHSQQDAGNSNRVEDTFLMVVEHDCSMNESEIRSWAEMDCYEENDEENEGKLRARINEG